MVVNLLLCDDIPMQMLEWIRFICGHSENSLIYRHMLKNRFGEFHLPAHNEFFDYFVEQWLENKEIPDGLWSCYHRRHRMMQYRVGMIK
jgi:hypothetical protein